MSFRTIETNIHLLTREEGGRSSRLLSKYRSVLRFEGTEVDFGFELELTPGAEAAGLLPGESGTALLTFWAVEELPSLSLDQRFEIREGSRVVGYGSITQVKS